MVKIARLVKFSIATCFLLSIAGWVSYKKIKQATVKPDVIVVLGGDEARERFAAQLAQKNPDLRVWISSGSPENYVMKIFLQVGIKKGDRLHLDYQAIDTVTNFTSLVDQLKAKGIDSVYLITSENHMPRAMLIGEIIFGSRNILIKPIAIPSQAPPEPMVKLLRDGARAIIWVAIGKSGASFHQSWQQILSQHQTK